MGIYPTPSLALPTSLQVTADLFDLAHPWTLVTHCFMKDNWSNNAAIMGLGDAYPTPTNYVLATVGGGGEKRGLGIFTTGGSGVQAGSDTREWLNFLNLTHPFPGTSGSLDNVRPDSIALRYSHDRVSIWRNGRYILDTGLTPFTPTHLVLGGDYTGIGLSLTLQGLWTSWFAWTRALTGEELRRQRVLEVPVSTDRLWAWWRLDEDPDVETIRDRRHRRIFDVVEGFWNTRAALYGLGPLSAEMVPYHRRRPLPAVASPPAPEADPAATFAARAARLGGEPLVELFELTVSAPEARTWYLAAAPIAESALWSGSPAYQGLVLDGGVTSLEAAIAGVSSGTTRELVLDNRLGTGDGPGRRFSDWFASPVPGFVEPYDLDSARLTVTWTLPGLAQTERILVQSLVIVPEAKVDEPGAYRLSFGEDPNMWGPLPRRHVGTDIYPSAAPEEFGQPIPLIFGRRRRVRCLAVDKQNGRYLIGESPQTTPLRRIRKVLAVLNDPVTGVVTPFPLTSVDPAVAVVSNFNSTIWRSLTVARAQEVVLDTGIIVYRVIFALRPRTTGTGAGYLINNGAGYPAGTNTVAVDTGAGTILVGDRVTFGSVTGEYQVITALSGSTFTFIPGLLSPVLDNATVSVIPSPPPAGRVQVSLEWMDAGVPGGTGLGRGHHAEINAALLTNPVGEYYSFIFGTSPDLPPPIWPGTRSVAMTVSYSPAAGGGEVEISMDDAGTYLQGTSFEESQGEWLPSGRNLKVYPVTGDPDQNDEQTGSAQQGDTMIEPERGLLNWAIEDGEHVLLVGQWYAPFPPHTGIISDTEVEEGEASAPTIGEPVENRLRAFFCFAITGIEDPVNRALLRLFLAHKYHITPGVDLILDEISDPRPMTKEKYDIAVRRSYGVIATSVTAEDTWLVTDVTASFETARADDLDHVCFRLRLSTEEMAGQGAGTEDDDLDAIGYAIAASENLEEHRPTLKIRFLADDGTGGRDLSFAVYGRSFDVWPSTDDGSGNYVAFINFRMGLDDPIIAARVDGMQDDTEGTYTAIPNQMIVNGSDIARFLLTAPIGRGLATSQLDDEAFRVQRTRLLHADKDRSRAVRPYLTDGMVGGIALRRWGPLAGVVAEELDVRQWLARLGQCCKAIFFVDDKGQIKMWADIVRRTGPNQPRLNVQPDQIGSLQQGSSGRRTQGFPWTRVEVYFNRDLLILPNNRPKFNQPEWNDFYVISGTRSLPFDRLRQRRASILTARYGVRSNLGPDAPKRIPGVPSQLGEAVTFHFLGGAPDYHTALLVRNYLWDLGSRRPDPFDIIELTLPRMALPLQLMDEITVEAYEFAGEIDRALPGTLGGVALAPEGWDVPLYRCRRGLYSVRRIEARITQGAEFPVTVTAQLLGWETP